MSSTTSQLDFKQLLIDNTKAIGETYASDFSYIPEDKLGACPMGKARTALEFTGECSAFNRYIANLVKGTVPPPRSEEERDAYYASLNTGAKAIGALNESVHDLVSALSSASDEDLFKQVSLPWGMEVPLHKAVSMAGGHMMYHCGQLNYIQSLFGDDSNHWG